MDLYSRCITRLRLAPVTTKAIDAAAVLFESVRPLPEPAAGQAGIRPPCHGIPGHVVINAAKLATEDGELLPSVAAETIVVDHGKTYLSCMSSWTTSRKRFSCSLPMVFLPQGVMTLRQCLPWPGSLPTASTGRAAVSSGAAGRAGLPVSAGQAARDAQRCRKARYVIVTLLVSCNPDDARWAEPTTRPTAAAPSFSFLSG
jgi:hypothetical protein